MTSPLLGDPERDARRIIACIRRNAREHLTIGRDKNIEGRAWPALRKLNLDGARAIRVDRVGRVHGDIVKLDFAVHSERYCVVPRAVAVEGPKPRGRRERWRVDPECVRKQCSGIGSQVPPFKVARLQVRGCCFLPAALF